MAEETAALRKRMAITKMNCITASLYRRRNQRVSRGMKKAIATQNPTTFTTNQSQNSPPPPSLWAATIMASTTKERNRAIMVEPTLSDTAEFR